jgi:asparagine synthase (glutamine-hydrolysing)
MPGIVGVITKQPPGWGKQKVGAMLDVIRHERFYRSGATCDEELGVYVGWTARRGSFSDGMPLRECAGGAELIFSGEEYRDDPGWAGDREYASNASPASYLAGFCESSNDFLAELNGRFHGIVIDRKRASVILFNDRYGMHRIYYYDSGDAFYFSAEAKAILAVCPELRTIDFHALGEYISCGCVLENRTLFAGLYVLPPASAWTFRNGLIESKKSYFHASQWEMSETLEPEVYYQQLRRVFGKILPRYFKGAELLAMSLTGGLDTRMIMAYANRSAGSLPCYSFGGMFRECEDVKIARRVAERCGQPYQVIAVGREFLASFPHYAERTVFLTDGCVDPSHSPDLFANERAAAIAPIRMTGNYGSEVLRGSRAFKPVRPAPALFSREFSGYIEAAAVTYRELTDCHPLSFAVFRQAPWHHHGLLSLEESQLGIRSPFLDNDLVRLVYSAPRESKSVEISLRLIADGSPLLADIPTDRGRVWNESGPMARARTEFLEFTAKAEYAFDYGMPQWLARLNRRMRPVHLERLFLGRHKFYHFQLWYRDYLAGYLKEILLDQRALARPYLQPGAAAAIVQGHISGRCNYTLEIHKLLSLELIHRLFIDSDCNISSHQDAEVAEFPELAG